MLNHNAPTTAPRDAPRTPPKHLALAIAIAVLAVMLLLLLRSLTLPLVFAAIVAVLAHPLQERLVRRMGGLGWLAAAGLTLAFALAVFCPPVVALSLAYEDLRGLLREVEPDQPGGRPVPENIQRLRPAIVWVSETTGVGEERVRGWIRDGARNSNRSFTAAR